MTKIKDTIKGAIKGAKDKIEDTRTSSQAKDLARKEVHDETVQQKKEVIKKQIRSGKEDPDC